MPEASQCQTSTVAPAMGAWLPPAWPMLKTSASGVPGRTELSEGSLRMSERLSFSSTKYGPSVSSGRAMRTPLLEFDAAADDAPDLDAGLAAMSLPGDAVLAAWELDLLLPPQATSKAVAPAAPRS